MLYKSVRATYMSILQCATKIAVCLDFTASTCKLSPTEINLY